MSLKMEPYHLLDALWWLCFRYPLPCLIYRSIRNDDERSSPCAEIQGRVQCGHRGHLRSSIASVPTCAVWRRKNAAGKIAVEAQKASSRGIKLLCRCICSRVHVARYRSRYAVRAGESDLYSNASAMVYRRAKQAPNPKNQGPDCDQASSRVVK